MVSTTGLCSFATGLGAAVRWHMQNSPSASSSITSSRVKLVHNHTYDVTNIFGHPFVCCMISLILVMVWMDDDQIEIVTFS